MINKRTLAWVGLALLALGFVLVFMKVLEIRFSSGDVYPHYATFRNDPLGCSALYESFEALDNFSVDRNLKALTAISGLDGDTALFLLGLPWDEFERLRAKDDSPVVQAIKEKGARLIITLNPKMVPQTFRTRKPDEEEDWIERRRKLREERAKEKSGGEIDEEDKKRIEKELEKDKTEALGERFHKQLGVEIPDVEDFTRPDEGWETKPGKSIDPKGVPKSLPIWYSQYRLKPGNKNWKSALLVGKEPVVLERKWGKGSILIATDSFFASNEALHSGGDPEFLLWLTGGKSKLVF